MNKLYGEFTTVFSFDNLYHSYKLCCRGVSWKASTQKYKSNALLNVVKTKNQLEAGSYKSSGFYEFDIFERGKPRHIRSVHISERVVQRCLCDNAIVPMFSRSFIYDNGASLQGKGIDFALDRLNCHLQRHYRKYGNDGYVLVFDFSKFFDNILHKPIHDELDRRFTDERVKKYTKQFVDAFGDVGLGLGSQVSQICALMFPNPLDHFIKERLHIKGYGRYMDDGYLIHHDKHYLEYCLSEIKKVCAGLGIVLNQKKTQIVKLTKGITFLKTKFSLSPTGRVVRRVSRKSVTVMRRKLKKFKRWKESGKLTQNDIRTSFHSWLGHLSRFDSHRTRRRMWLFYKKLFLEVRAVK